MSTTNPGQTDPVSALAPTPPGAPAADDHDRAGSPSEAVIKRGYEQDGYDAKSVISVPILVFGFFVLAFTSVTIMFAYFRHTPVDPMAHPQAVEDNERPLPERIASTPARGRPEPLKILDEHGGNARSITRPASHAGNPPEFHPEDIRPSLENTPRLFETRWDGKSKFASVPLDDAKAAALKSGLLKAREHPIALPDSSTVPSSSNAGRGGAKGQVAGDKH